MVALSSYMKFWEWKLFKKNRPYRYPYSSLSDNNQTAAARAEEIAIKELQFGYLMCAPIVIDDQYKDGYKNCIDQSLITKAGNNRWKVQYQAANNDRMTRKKYPIVLLTTYCIPADIHYTLQRLMKAARDHK